jgi:hypothetical protein
VVLALINAGARAQDVLILDYNDVELRLPQKLVHEASSVTGVKLTGLQREEHTAGLSLSRLAILTSRRTVLKISRKSSDLMSMYVVGSKVFLSVFNLNHCAVVIASPLTNVYANDEYIFI